MRHGNRCANGKVGYDLITGKMYVPRGESCQRPANPGHIYCEACRLAAGGFKR